MDKNGKIIMTEKPARQRMPWSEEEKETLAKMFEEGHTIAEIAVALNRTKSSVENKFYIYWHEGCFANKNSAWRKWTTAEVRELKELWRDGYTLMEISKALNRTYNSVDRKTHRMKEEGILHAWRR